MYSTDVDDVVEVIVMEMFPCVEVCYCYIVL